MIALVEDRQLWSVLFVILHPCMIAAPKGRGGALSGLGSSPLSPRRTSANGRSDEILMCSSAIVWDFDYLGHVALYKQSS